MITTVLNYLLSFEVRIILLLIFILSGTTIVILSFIKFKTNEDKRRKMLNLVLAGIDVLIVGLSGYTIYKLFAQDPKVISTYPVDKATLTNYEKPIRIEFNVPVTKKKLQTFMSPETAGTWQYVDYPSFFPLARVIEFKPQQTFPASQKVLLYLSYISTPFHTQAGNEFLLELHTSPLPAIIETTPADGSQNILPSEILTLKTDTDQRLKAGWKIVSTPEAEWEIDSKEADQIKILPKKTLLQNQLYKIQIFRSPAIFDISTRKIVTPGDEELVKEFSFTTVAAPLLKEIIPTGSEILPNTELKLTFDDPVKLETFHITTRPEIKGEWQWDETKTMVSLRPTENLSLEADYALTIQKGLTNQKGGVLEADYTQGFSTVGTVKIKSVSPKSPSTGIALEAPIVVEFNQPIDHQSAESLFKITPAVNGTFSWQNNTMTFTHTNFQFETLYSFVLQKGIKSEYGKDLSTDLSYSFTTRQSQFLMRVTLYEQEESFTCNIAAARAALAYRGKMFTEAQIKNAVGTVGVRGSGNPHLGFVENYGTYWEPISNFIGLYRRNQVFTNWNLTELLQEVERGNPVIVWGHNGWSTPTNISWTASDGTYIYAISGMHSYIVTGFVGTPQNPTLLYITDPWRGYITMTPALFNQRWQYFKTGLVVY